MFDYPFPPNTDVRGTLSNREYIERTLAQEAAEPATEEAAEHDVSTSSTVPFMPPTPSDPTYE